MTINQQIIKGLENELWPYGLQSESLKTFFKTFRSLEKRQIAAGDLIAEVMADHGKKHLYRQISVLAKVERYSQQLQPRMRDHVVHSFITYLFGAYINEKVLAPDGFHVDPFQWKLASLFHDIGYPIQVANGVNRIFSDAINEVGKELGLENFRVGLGIDFSSLATLPDGQNALDLIQTRLDQWGLRVDANKELRRVITTQNVCHGMVSAFAVMYIICALYQKHNPDKVPAAKYDEEYIDWNYNYFTNDVVSCCTAIFCHNLPATSFNSIKIKISRAPLAYLLKITDSLQEWQRPSADSALGTPASNFRLSLHESKIYLRALVDNDTKSKMRSEMDDVLEEPVVVIE